MTKKDFELIARVLKAGRNADRPDSSITVDAIAEDFAGALAKENPRFDRRRFLKACQ